MAHSAGLQRTVKLRAMFFNFLIFLGVPLCREGFQDPVSLQNAYLFWKVEVAEGEGRSELRLVFFTVSAF